MWMTALNWSATRVEAEVVALPFGLWPVDDADRPLEPGGAHHVVLQLVEPEEELLVTHVMEEILHAVPQGRRFQDEVRPPNIER
jgi:hypothetical protein